MDGLQIGPAQRLPLAGGADYDGPWLLNVPTKFRPIGREGGSPMDKKVKKKLDVLHKKLATLHKQLAGARLQADEPEMIRTLEQQVADAEEQVAKLKQA